MDVVSTGATRVASAVWQPRPGKWALTVVCKLTFRLAPGESPLADLQDDPILDDAHWDDDPARSLALVSDLVPFKPCADVLLVGHAFAPGGRAVRSMSARLVVGSIDKRIEVWCDRIFWHDGSLLEGPPFARMPLRYERAAGGPGTENPVGLRWDAPPDARGLVPVPNLQPARTRIARRGDTFAPIAFGPIASSWRGRTEKLGRHAAGFAPGLWREQPLPGDFDAAYFNVAPPDQQVPTLAADEFILLEGLHAEHPRLETTLPGERPVARIATGSRAGEEIALTADTLIIDTDRGVATVTWRGLAPLSTPTEPGEITVDDEGTDAIPTISSNTNPATVVIGRGAGRSPALPFTPKPTREETARTVLGGKIGGPALPFVPPLSPWARPSAAEPIVLRDPALQPSTGTLLVVRGKAPEVLPFQAPAAAPAAMPTEIVDEVTPSLPAARAPEPPASSYEPPAYDPPAHQPPALEARPPIPPGYGPFGMRPLGYTAPQPQPLPPEPPPPGPAEIAAAPAPEVPEEPEPVELPIERCAAIAASIARRPDDRSQILEAEKVSAADFAREEPRWGKALKDEAGRGKRALAQAYDAAYLSRLEEERGPIEVAEYGRLVVAGERGKLAETLAELGLPRGAMMRVERVWLAKTMRDPALGKSVTRAVKAAREG